MITAAILGCQWRDHLIQFSVDNMAMVHNIELNLQQRWLPYAPNPDPGLLAAHFDFWFRAKHTHMVWRVFWAKNHLKNLIEIK